MRGRLTYNQVNAVIQEINKAVVSKYKIMHQSTKTMSGAIRNLYFRFQEEETKNTKGKPSLKHTFLLQLQLLELPLSVFSGVTLLSRVWYGNNIHF